MPILDKLTTVVEWDVDTGTLERYEALVGTSEAATIDLSQAIGKTDTEISGVDTSGLEVLSEVVEGLAGEFGEVPLKAESAASGIDSIGNAAEEVSVDIGKMTAESAAALKELVRLASESQKTSRELDEAGKAAAKVAKEEKEAAAKAKNLKDGFASLGQGIAGTISQLIKLGSIATGVLTGIGVLSAREISINTRLAGSVGMTTDAYLAWDGILSQMGMSGERVVDMVEETANKLGELQGLGKMSSAQDALKMLGMEFANIKDLAPEEQFREIMSAAKELGDEKIARSAVDMIFGGEANKVLGHLRNLDGSLKEILESEMRFNFLTAEGIEGSKQLHDGLSNLATAGKTLSAEITGRLAKNLGPMVDRFFDWVAANRELIDQKIEGVVRAISDAIRWIGWGVEKLVKLVEALGGAGRIIKEVALAFGAWKLQSWITQLSQLAAKMTLSSGALTAMKGAAAGLKSIGLAGLFSTAYLALEDLYYFLTGGKSAIGKFMDEQLPKAEGAFLHFMGVIDEGMTEQEQRDVTAAFRVGFMEGIDRAKEFFTSIADFAGGAVDILKGDFSGFFDFSLNFFVTIESKILSMGRAVVSFFGGIGESISGFFTNVIDGIGEKINSFVASAKIALHSIPVIGNLIEDQPVSSQNLNLTRGVRGASAAGLQAIPSGMLFAGSGGSSVSNTFNSPITVNAAAGMNTSEVAGLVVAKMKETFKDVKTTGIRR